MAKGKQNVIEATPVTVKNIAKWLRENLYLIKDDEAGSRFNRVLCRHLVKGNKKGEEVFFIDVPKKAKDDWSENAALDIYGRLSAESATLGGLQKYALYSFHSDDNENHTSRFVVRMQGAEDDDGDDLDSEGPDKQGLTSQAMRHAEAYAKINTSAQMTLLSNFQTLVSRQSAMIEKLLDARLSSIDAIEELLQKKEEREINLIQARSKADATKAVADKLGLLLPAVANRIAGQNLFPVQANAMMMMVKGLVTSIVADESKMQAIMAQLTPEQTIAFMNIVEEVSKVGENGLPTDGANGKAIQTTTGD